MTAQVPLHSLRLNLLLDQQLWFLGHDIRHPEGNALVRFGFDRVRPSSSGGTTCYRLAAENAPSEALVVWGFALYRGSIAPRSTEATRSPRGETPAGVLLFRHAASARLVWPAMRLPLHKPSELPRLEMPRTPVEQGQLRDGMIALARALHAYERWTVEALGPSHRRRVMATLPRHKRRRFVDLPDLAEPWRAVEARYAAW
jgi:hypothetical protein